MTWKGKGGFILEWSFVAAGLIALFWCTWYLIAGSIPTVTSITICPWWTINLPFAISRGWDILLVFIGSAISIMFFTDAQNKFSVGDDFFILLSGLVCALVIGFISKMIIFGIATGWIFLACELILFREDFKEDIVFFELKFGLILGVSFGLIYGMATGFLVFTLTGGPAIIFGLIKKHIPKRDQIITS